MIIRKDIFRLTETKNREKGTLSVDISHKTFSHLDLSKEWKVIYAELFCLSNFSNVSLIFFYARSL